MDLNTLSIKQVPPKWQDWPHPGALEWISRKCMGFKDQAVLQFHPHSASLVASMGSSLRWGLSELWWGGLRGQSAWGMDTQWAPGLIHAILHLHTSKYMCVHIHTHACTHARVRVHTHTRVLPKLVLAKKTSRDHFGQSHPCQNCFLFLHINQCKNVSCRVSGGNSWEGAAAVMPDKISLLTAILTLLGSCLSQHIPPGHWGSKAPGSPLWAAPATPGRSPAFPPPTFPLCFSSTRLPVWSFQPMRGWQTGPWPKAYQFIPLIKS